MLSCLIFSRIIYRFIFTLKTAIILPFVSVGAYKIDDKGNVIQESIPKDLATMEKMYHEHTATIKNLTNKVNDLTKENKKLKKQLESKTSDTKNSKE